MVQGKDMDGRGDLYSVGVVLFELLTGRRPFMHASIERLMWAHADDRPPTFAAIGLPELVSPALEAVVMNCLAKHPEDRPASAWALALAYEKALGRRITGGRGPSSQGSGLRPAVSPGSGVRPAVSPGSGVRPAVLSAAERHAFQQSVEATMPEAMAMIKLRGFIYDLGGEVVESVPGMIKVRLVERGAAKKSGLFAWVSGDTGRKATVLGAPTSTDIELHMERRDPTQASKLTITLVMRPGGGMATTEWRNRCTQISRDLQAYLMGR
jgi:serine/threonine-protein kinase